MNLRQQVEYRECYRCRGAGRVEKKERKPLRINCEYVGTIFTKNDKKIGRGDNKGELSYQLICEVNALGGKTEQIKMQVFSDAVDKRLFQAIQDGEYVDKKYLFYCNREGQYLRLLD